MEQNNYQDVTSLLQTLKSLPGYVPVPEGEAIRASSQPQQEWEHDAAEHHTSYDTSSIPYSFNQPGEMAAYDQAYAQGIPSTFDSAGYYSNAYMPPTSTTSLAPYQYYDPPPPSRLQSQAVNISHLQQSKAAATSKPKQPMANPRLIITWPAALRHITSIAADPQFGPAVKKLITNQHNNEKQWWASRLALIDKQKTRVNGKAELNDVLKSLGGMTDRSAAVDDAAELRAYDKKVHRAATQMEKAMLADFVTMGVPFFGTEERLVVEDDLGNASEKGKITKQELKTLQMRMVQHLEDMYGD